MSRALRFLPISEIAASAPAKPDWTWDGYLAVTERARPRHELAQAVRERGGIAEIEAARVLARQHDADERRAS